MGTFTAAERASETRDESARRVAQLSSLGSLADDVVTDLIRVEAKILVASDSASITHAAALLAGLAADRDRPIEVWSESGAQETFRQLSTFGDDVEITGILDEKSLEMVKALAAEMSLVVRDEATVPALHRLQTFFTNLASATMSAAQSSMLGRGTATSWLTR